MTAIPLHVDATHDPYEAPRPDDELALDIDWRCLGCGHSADDHDEDGCARAGCPCGRRP